MARALVPHPLERSGVELVRRVRGLVVVRIERREGRVGGEYRRVARLQERQVVRVQAHAEGPHRRLVEPREPRVPHGVRGPRVARGSKRRAHEPGRRDHRASQRAGPGTRSGAAPGAPRASPTCRSGTPPRASGRAGRAARGTRASRPCCPCRPSSTLRRRTTRTRASAAAARPWPARARARSGRPRRRRRRRRPALHGVVVRADHDELLARCRQRRGHVRAHDTLPLERLQLDRREAGVAPLRGDVRGRGLVRGEPHRYGPSAASAEAWRSAASPETDAASSRPTSELIRGRDHSGPTRIAR